MFRRWAFLIIISVLAGLCSAGTIPVNLDGTGDYTTIQAGIDAAFYGDTVNVAVGTYVENITLKDGVAVIGADPTDTIIDGNQNGSVVTSISCGSDTLLEGFTIINGTRDYGGGIYCYETELAIINCIIIDNEASMWGGGLCLIKSSCIVKNSIINNNSVTYRSGGGIFCAQNSSLKSLNSIIIANSANDGNGGGIACWNQSSAEIINCIINGNSVGGDNPLAEGFGGAVHCYDDSAIQIVNSTFVGNRAISGRALACNSSDSTAWPQPFPCVAELTNCVLWNSPAEIWNESIYASAIEIDYSNVYDGWEGEGNINIDPLFVADGCWDDNGTGDDLSDDFWVEGDYHLLPESPCIDAGDPSHIIDPNETDLDDNVRVLDGNYDGVLRIDMGAYEYQPLPIVQTDVSITPRTLNLKSKGSWINCSITIPPEIEIIELETDSILLVGQFEATEIVISDDADEIVAKFDRQAVNNFLIDQLLTGELEITVTVVHDSGIVLAGSDIIRIINEI